MVARQKNTSLHFTDFCKLNLIKCTMLVGVNFCYTAATKIKLASKVVKKGSQKIIPLQTF
jgi:hypothetical protein